MPHQPENFSNTDPSAGMVFGSLNQRDLQRQALAGVPARPSRQLGFIGKEPGMSRKYGGNGYGGKSNGTGTFLKTQLLQWAPGRAQFWLEGLEERRMLSARSGSDLAIARGTAQPAVHAHRHPLPVGGLYLTTDALAVGQYNAIASSAGQKVLFLGGDPNFPGGGGTFLNTFETGKSSQIESPVPQLSTVSAATTLGGQALFVGSDVTRQIGLVSIYNPITGGFTSQPQPHNRVGVAATSVGDRAIFAGGISIPADNGSPNDTAEFYNAKSGAWFEMRLPQSLNSTRAFAVSIGGKALFTDGINVELYDSSSRLWSSQNLYETMTLTSAVSVGTKAYFSGTSIYGTGTPDNIQVYDGVTGQSSIIDFPDTFTVDAATSVGGKILFAGRYTRYNETGYEVNVYDTRTGAWSKTALSEGRDSESATTLGARAYFGGGKTQSNSGESATVDIFTDATPAAILEGASVRSTANAVRVTIRNTGDAPLPAGASVGIYPSSIGTFQANSRPLVMTRLKTSLPAGASKQMTFQLALPSNGFPTGTKLLAVVKSRGTVTPIAQISTTPVVVPPLATVPAAQLLDTPTVSLEGFRTPGTSVGTKILFAIDTYAIGSHRTGAEIFDTVNASWRTVTLPHALGPNVTVVGDKAIFVGAATQTSPYTSGGTGIADIYDDATGQFSTALLSVARLDIGAVTVGDKAIFAGGHLVDGYSGAVGLSTAVDIFNSSTGLWSTATLSQAHGGVTGVVVGKIVIFAGGINGGYQNSPANAVDIYDSATNTWSATEIPVKSLGPFGLLKGVEVGGKALFTDGTSAFLYNPADHVWSISTLSAKRNIASIVSVGGIALIAGGYGLDQSGMNVELNVVDIYNSATGLWSTSQLPHTNGFAVGVFANREAVFGGNSTGLSGYLDVYDPSTGLWSSQVRPVGHLYSSSLSSLGNQLLVSESNDAVKPALSDILTSTSVPVPANPSPPDGALLASPPTIFTWSPSPKADSYDVYVDETLVQNVPSNQWTPITPPLTGSHTWRVIAKFGAGGLGSSLTSFVVLSPP